MSQEDWAVPKDYIENVLKEWCENYEPFWAEQPTIRIDSYDVRIHRWKDIEFSIKLPEEATIDSETETVAPLTYACGWYPKQLPTPENMALGIDRLMRYIYCNPLAKEIEPFILMELGDVPINLEFPKESIDIKDGRSLIIRIPFEFDIWKSFDQLEEKLVLRGRYSSVDVVLFK